MADVYSVALGAMNVSRKEIGFNSHNIANVGVEGYTRLTVEKETRIINGEVGGVDIQNIVSNVDEILQDTLYSKISSDRYETEIKSYLEKMHGELGHPGQGDSIDSLITKTQIALKNLSETPTSSSHKLLAVQSLQDLTSKISATAKRFEEFRFEIDKEVAKSINTLNGYLESAYKQSNSMPAFPRGTMERVNIEDGFRNSMEKISEFLEVTKYYDSAGVPKVLASQGITIVGESPFFLKYTPQSNLTDLLNDKELQPIVVSYYSSDKVDQNFNRVIVEGGKSSEIESNIRSGKLGALTFLRDKEIPKALSQLDTLAKGIKEEFNKIHNEGASNFSPTKMSGTTLVARDQNYGFSGQSRIVLLDNQGKQVPGTSPLTLDFTKLDTGNGVGKANLEGIIQEINYHFGKKITDDNSVILGNISDVKLVAMNKDMAVSSTFDFDLELQNLSGKSATAQIMNATAVDQLGNNILNSYVNTAHTIAAATTERTGTTGPSVKLNIPAAVNYPFTITLDVRVNDGTSNFDSQMTFVINNPASNHFNGLKNHRFSVNTADNQGAISNPVYTTPLLSAQMFNTAGSLAIDTSIDKGLLQLTTLGGDYHIAIDNMNSQQLGNAAANIVGTKNSFSYYLGLNDLFVSKDAPENFGNTKNAAYYLDLRSDIKSDSNKLSIGKLQRQVDQANPANILSTFEVSTGDIRNISLLNGLSEKSIFFAASGTLPATTVSMQHYAAEIIGFNTATLAKYETSQHQANLMHNSIKEKIQDLKGVNINEELANMMINQQNMVANARVINVARELDQILMSIFN